MIQGNEPAMPTTGWVFLENENNKVLKGGLTIRQHFAATAMQGLCATIKDIPLNDAVVAPENIAKWSVAFADALITELNKQP